jgi:hypothetical protein
MLEFVCELLAVDALDEESRALEAAQRFAQLVGRHVASRARGGSPSRLHRRRRASAARACRGARGGRCARRAPREPVGRDRRRVAPGAKADTGRAGRRARRVDHVAHVLFDEQRIAAALRGQLVLDRRKRGIVAEKIGDDPARRRRREAVEADLDVARDRSASSHRSRSVREQRERGTAASRAQTHRGSRGCRTSPIADPRKRGRAGARPPSAAEPHQRGEHALAPLGEPSGRRTGD